MIFTICDLDGCIADDRHRLGLIDTSRLDPWEDYHAACWNDRFMNAGCVIGQAGLLIFTSRCESVRAETERWLARHGIRPLVIKMRPVDDKFTSSVDLKERFLKEVFSLPIGGANVIAYDDRDDILSMYRRYNVRTIKVTYEA